MLFPCLHQQLKIKKPLKSGSQKNKAVQLKRLP